MLDPRLSSLVLLILTASACLPATGEHAAPGAHAGRAGHAEVARWTPTLPLVRLPRAARPPLLTGTPLDVVLAPWALEATGNAVADGAQIALALPALAEALPQLGLALANSAVCEQPGPDLGSEGIWLEHASTAVSDRLPSRAVLVVDLTGHDSPATRALVPRKTAPSRRAVQIEIWPRRDGSSAEVTLTSGGWLLCELGTLHVEVQPPADEWREIDLALDVRLDERGLVVRGEVPARAVLALLRAEQLLIRVGNSERRFRPRTVALPVSLSGSESEE